MCCFLKRIYPFVRPNPNRIEYDFFFFSRASTITYCQEQHIIFKKRQFWYCGSGTYGAQRPVDEYVCRVDGVRDLFLFNFK